MRVFEAQQDISRAYVGGGPGVIVSALVWLAAAVVLPMKGVSFAFCVLFIGGMLIFPVGTLVSRYGYRREREKKENVLSRTALESTGAIITACGLVNLFVMPDRTGVAFIVAAAEFVFGTIIIVKATRRGLA